LSAAVAFTFLRIDGPCRGKMALEIWLIGRANWSVEVGQQSTMEVRLPRMCRLVFHMVSTDRAFAA
jgi:hypothetical protein